MSIHMTERAAQEFKNLCKVQALPMDKMKLRLEAQPTSEKDKFSVVLRIDDQALLPDDLVDENSDVRLVFNKKLNKALGEARVDYDHDRGGFFVEPL